MAFLRRTLLLITLWACLVWIQVECNPTGVNTTAESEKQGSEEIQRAHEKVAALDRTASFGDIYDATTHSLWSMSIFRESVSNEAIQQTNSSHSSIQIIGDETLKERMRKLDIPPSQFISLLLELGTSIEERKYLERFTRGRRTAQASLLYKFRTVVESFDPFSNESVAITDERMLEISDQTHAVVGLEYGADLVLTLKKKCTSPASAKEAQKQLEAELQSIIDYVSGGGTDPSSNHSEWHQLGGFDMSADFAFDTLPLTISEIVSVIKKFPKQLNGGKGKIKGFILEPLRNIRASLDIQSNKTGVAKKMDQELIDKLLNVFQELEDSTHLIDNLYDGMDVWRRMLPSNLDEKMKISDIKSDFDRYKYNLKEDLKKRVVGFRRGKVESETIKEIISSYENGNRTAATISNTISNNFNQTMKKIDLMNLLRAKGANFIGSSIDDQLYIVAMNDDDKELRFLSADLSMDISSPYVQDIVKLLEASNDSDTARYYIKDAAGLARPKIEVYKDGKKKKTILVGKE